MQEVKITLQSLHWGDGIVRAWHGTFPNLPVEVLNWKNYWCQHNASMYQSLNDDLKHWELNIVDMSVECLQSCLASFKLENDSVALVKVVGWYDWVKISEKPSCLPLLCSSSFVSGGRLFFWNAFSRFKFSWFDWEMFSLKEKHNTSQWWSSVLDITHCWRQKPIWPSSVFPVFSGPKGNVWHNYYRC